ncbi:MAG TPA: hypothetical protein VL983_01905 [Terriglobales bacterium]|nr:hypothetical protein [Terriglobales bacterium]
MRVHARALSVAVFVVAILVSVPFARGAVGVVGNCKAGLVKYGSIGAAITSLPAGSTLYVCPGAYAEQLVITKKLTIVGVGGNGLTGASAAGANNPTIVAPSGGVAANATDLYAGYPPIAAQVLVSSPSNATAPIVVNISNITVDGTNNGINGCSPNLVGIFYQNASGTVAQITTKFQYQGGNALNGCQSGLGIMAEENGDYGATTIKIENSSVHDYNKNGITVDGVNLSGTVNATVSGNYVVGVGATPLIAQNGIQISDGAVGKVTNNTVSGDVYINPSPCYADQQPYCYSASGILLYDSGGTSGAALVVQGNSVSNTQGAIVAYGDSAGNADFVSAISNKITTSPAAGIFNIDGIDLCSNNDTATSNIVYNSSGSGIHIDSSCTEEGGTSGNNASVTKNTVVEACAGVLTGTGGGNASSPNTTYDVRESVYAGDSCPTGSEAAGALERIGNVRTRPSAYAAGR